jgi:hypothetical protein
MPATFVKPYAKRGKSDAIDAEAICEAATRPTMRFVPVKVSDVAPTHCRIASRKTLPSEVHCLT